MKIILYGNPLSTQHIYGQKGKIRYLKTEAKKLKESYIMQIKSQYRGGILTCPLLVQIDLYFKDNRKRDFDNWHKLTLDATEGIIVKNDSQYDCNGIYRHFGDKNPRIELTIIDAK